MKSRFLFVSCISFIAFCMALGLVAGPFAVAGPCDLYRLIDQTDEAATNSEFVKQSLEKKGYTVKDIYTLDETKELPEGSFWGFFKFKSVKRKSGFLKRFDWEIMVNFYSIQNASAEQEREKLIFHQKSSSVEKRALTDQEITQSLGFISKCGVQ